MMELGALISEANGLLAKSGCDSMFGAWIESECSISRRTAYNWMAAYERFGGHADRLANLTAETIYYLSGMTVDLDSVDRVLEAAQTEKIGIEQAKAIVQGLHNSKPEPATREVETTHDDPPDLDDECDTHQPASDGIQDDGAPSGQGKGAGSGAYKEASDLVDEIEMHLTEAIWKLDALNGVLPQDRLHQSVLDSIDLASRDISLWKQMIRE